MRGQRGRTLRCPAAPRIEGQRALVTGGSRGIGLETSRGLAARGAEVLSAARDATSGEKSVAALRSEFGRPAHFLPLDLGDLESVRAAVDRVAELLPGRALDILVANAGLWPTAHRLSAQGHEIAFATNVLGHHALIRGLLDRKLLAEDARVVVVTGDIYVMARGCSADYAYRGALGGQRAYCRSKLGNLWYVRELAQRHPTLRVHAVHPGVIATDLGSPSTGLSGAVKRAVMISPEEGAQTSLFCATQPGLESGAYYHNTLGRVELRPDDPASDAAGAADLWSLIETPRLRTPLCATSPASAVVEDLADDLAVAPGLHRDLLLDDALPALRRELEDPLDGGLIAVHEDAPDLGAVELDAVHEGLLVGAVRGLADALVDAVLAHHHVVRVPAVEGAEDVSLQDAVDHGLYVRANAHGGFLC